MERYEEVLKAIFFVKLLQIADLLGLADNVRRYVQLVQSRGGACFCTRGAVQDYDGYYLTLALAKTVTPRGGPRREPGRPAPPLKVYHFDQNVLAVQKPIAYTDLLWAGFIYFARLGLHLLRLGQVYTMIQLQRQRSPVQDP